MLARASTYTADGGRCTVHGGLRVVSDTGFSPQVSLCVRDAIALGATGPLPLSPKITVGGTRGWDDEGTLLRRPTLRDRARGHDEASQHRHRAPVTPFQGALGAARPSTRHCRPACRWVRGSGMGRLLGGGRPGRASAYMSMRRLFPLPTGPWEMAPRRQCALRPLGITTDSDRRRRLSLGLTSSRRMRQTRCGMTPSLVPP